MEKKPKKNIKILFVEDEEALQKSMGRALEFEGYNVLTAADGESGYNIAIKEKPDLILLDLILPKMDGFEVLRSLKKNDETKKIPVAILTNLESTADIDKALELGALTYLVKANYELSDLLEKVDAMVSNVK
jgi:DNA-binding response OmpR family regulator